MFSFLKFLNSKSDTEKNTVSNKLSGKTLNLNSPEARTLNIFNTKSPIARKLNGNEYSLRSDSNEAVTSPGYSFRIAQKARETRSPTPNTDTSYLSTSNNLENSLNGSLTINSNNTTSRDIYDKKRKLMETLDNFGVRKRTRQECGVDAFVNRRRKTISETSNICDRGTVMNGHNHRATQPIVIYSKSGNVENKKIKRNADFESNMSHSQKKPRTRNNEILSSYSSSKFLLTPGQKRPHSNDNEGDSPNRKHCKSCTCCGSTVILETDQNNLKKKDKTTETDPSDNFVTVAASRIFNRSGKTQVIKKICMKTILDEVFEDIDPIPYTSIEKVEEKKKNVISNLQCNKNSNVKNDNQSVDSTTFVSSTTISKLNEINPTVTSILSTVPITPVTSTTLLSTHLVQSSTSPTLNIRPSERALEINEENKNKNITSLSFSFGNQKSSTPLPIDTNNLQSSEDKSNNKVSECTNNTFKTSNTIVQSSNEPHKLQFQNTETIENNINDKSPIEKPNNCMVDKDKKLLQFTEPASKSNEIVTNSSNVSSSPNFSAIQFSNQVDSSIKPGFTFGASTNNNKQSTSVMQFGAPKIDDKQSTTVMQFGAPKIDDKQSTPVMQFGAPKIDDKQSTPVMQFGAPKDNDKQSTPVMQFGTPKVDDQQSKPVMQFGASKNNNKQSSPIMQFGAPKVDDKQSTPILQFGATKESENPISSSSFLFANNNKNSIENTKSETDSAKFQFGSSKLDNTSVAVSSIESTNVGFGSNNLQNQNLFNFGKTGNPPKYDAPNEKTNPKLQFGALPTAKPVFGTETSNAEQLKPQFNTVSQSNDNQTPKLVFGSQITENKSTSTPGMIFTNNTANSMFQFNSSSLKPNDKPNEPSGSSFPFTSTKTAPTFGISSPQNIGDKSAFQFSAPKKAEEQKTQFSTPVFGSQITTTSAPFKFGGNDKPVSFGSTFSSTNQPLQFTNNTEKSVEPFKFGGTVTTSNAFQFGGNKTDNDQVKFGQTSNTFSIPGFSGFGSSTPQQTTTFGNVSSSQPSFGNMTSPNAAPAFGNVASPPSNTFGNVASPPSNTFGTNQGFQFRNTNNVPSSSSTFAFTGTSQPTKSDGAFNFNTVSTTTSPFQFGQPPSTLSTPQFGGTQSQGAFNFGSPAPITAGMPGSSQPLFSIGTAPAGERRKAKAVRRRQ